MTDGALAADLARRRDRDQQARTRRPVDRDEVAAVDADNTAWLADSSTTTAGRRVATSATRPPAAGPKDKAAAPAPSAALLLGIRDRIRASGGRVR